MALSETTNYFLEVQALLMHAETKKIIGMQKCVSVQN